LDFHIYSDLSSAAIFALNYSLVEVTADTKKQKEQEKQELQERQ
jgi:hypothetical protein